MPTRRTVLDQLASFGAAATAATYFPLSLASSSEKAKSVAKPRDSKSIRIKSLVRRDDTVIRHGGNGDNWHMSWASDDRLYVSLCDGGGFSSNPPASYNSRMLAITGGPLDAQFHDISRYPMLGRPIQKENDARYYNFGTLALDEHLYQFMSTFNRPLQADETEKRDPKNPLRFTGVKLIYSPNNGRTWHNQDGSTPVAWEDWNHRSRDTMVFFEEDQEAFSLLTVLQMGRNYEYNRDGYVYLYSPNGNTEGTMNELVMFRVPKGRILHRQSYEYFAGYDSKSSAKWTKDITQRSAVHTFPRGWINTFVHPFAWQPSVIFNAPLGIYIMANWGMGTSPDGNWFEKPSYLGFWISKNCWGPWTQIHEETSWMPAGDPHARAYSPQIAPKWISQDGRSFWLVWTDFQVTDPEARKRANDDYAGIPPDSYSAADVARGVNQMREYMPYYAFNAQRVDLTVY
ncbi:hypothetical protein ACFPN2_21050 [Steroidobacter flavus]|uniref:DUF4185 domain-containing protein n=1 Tax=Steroidobacter flavus TaxID=1842136 RepID=A0ABV8SWP1_9GAMM